MNLEDISSESLVLPHKSPSPKKTKAAGKIRSPILTEKLLKKKPELKRKSTPKKQKDKKRDRNWTLLEKEIFAEILSDVDHGYADKLENMALKRSANSYMFEEIGSKLKAKFNTDEYINENSKFFKERTEFPPLDISVDRLRDQYNALKRSWKKLTDEPLTKSGIAPKKEVKWFLLMDPVWNDSCSIDAAELASGSKDTSFTVDRILGEDDYENSDEEVDEEAGDGEDEGASRKEKKAKKSIIAAPYAKKEVFRSNLQVLGSVVNTFGKMSDGQSTRHKEQMEADAARHKEKREDEERRFQMMLEYRRSENEKNRQHELAMANVFAASIASIAPSLRQEQPSSTHRMGMTSHTISSPPSQYQQYHHQFSHSPQPNDPYSMFNSPPHAHLHQPTNMHQNMLNEDN